MCNIYAGNSTYLIPIQEKDTPFIVKWRNKDFVRNMFIQQDLLTADIHQKWLETMVNTHKVEQFIIYTKKENKAIGTIFLKNIDKVNGTAEYGNFIGEEEYLGKGYGTDAGKTIVQYALNKLNLRHIYLRVLKKNERAIRAYRKIGFKPINDLNVSCNNDNIIFMEIKK